MKNNQHMLKFKKIDRPKYVRLFFLGGVLAFVMVAVFQILKYTNLWEKVNSIEKIKKIVESGGAFSMVVFMLLQILQTTILQIPAILITVAGSLIFGSWTAFVLSFVAILLGSILMFFLGRYAGRKFLNWLIGKEDADKWIDRISQGKYLFFLMMLFPIFPDDILCAVAGVTNMGFKFFLITNILSRGIGVATTVFFSSGKVIPFTGWGLVIWLMLACLVAVLFYLSIRYKDKIDAICKNFVRK